MTQAYQNFRTHSETSALRDFTPDELADLLTVDQVILTDEYQANADIDGLLAEPVPRILFEINLLGAKALIGNTAFYDEDTEDAIAGDLVVEKLLLLPNSEQRAPALRARRAIIALALEWSNISAETGASEQAKTTHSDAA